MHLAGYGGPYAGSFVPMLRGVMRAARDRGWTCEAVFSSVARDRVWLDELRDDGIPFRIAPSNSRGDISRLVRSLLSESDEPTILHTHFTSFDIPAAMAADRHRAAKVFWHVHTPHHGSLPIRARNRLKYAVLGRRVERILCVSSELAEVIVEARRPARRGSSSCTTPSTSTGSGCSSDEEREIARLRLGLPADQPLLVHFGWDWQRKGGDLFMQALRALRERGIEAVGVTVGGGEPARELRDELGLGHAVHVLEPTDDVRALYAAADVFVSPSRAEGTPYSVMEALSSGTAGGGQRHPGPRDDGRRHRVVRDHPARPRPRSPRPPAAARPRPARRSRRTRWPRIVDAREPAPAEVVGGAPGALRARRSHSTGDAAASSPAGAGLAARR